MMFHPIRAYDHFIYIYLFILNFFFLEREREEIREKRGKETPM